MASMDTARSWFASKLHPKEEVEYFTKHSSCEIGMAACSGSYEWVI
jgi:hypothetical protein